ncbi:hypothetical protein EKO23_10940 [Nocardioides guangzhouensis]|uniref:Uncharacterized protein n=1 Tax=Nocardioides guangzhouensis TaxID=2497878 RepID=A0A4Q4ZDU7_9ACTN|nr:hypothetical protein [Nocardioides guangzhouensis]RYP85825.1 hypothetical protein EKO23_10940 [Nocardioides guangzhouensis]
MLAAGILLVVALVLIVATALLLRSWGRAESQTEERLHDPQVHTIVYAIPNGVDPVVFKTALSHAGFTSVTELVGGNERLLVECPEPQRARLRSVLESVHPAGLSSAVAGSDHVVFEDER